MVHGVIPTDGTNDRPAALCHGGRRADIHAFHDRGRGGKSWMPACAGMTGLRGPESESLGQLVLYQPTEPVTHGDNGSCHCERSEAIQGNPQDRSGQGPGLLRCARNDNFHP